MTDGDQRTAVAIARLEGEVSKLTEVVNLQVRSVYEEANSAKRSSKAAHSRIDDAMVEVRAEIDKAVAPLAKTVNDLAYWRERVVGMALGISFVSGLVSGGIVAALLRVTGNE